jgi:hypothetical protein
MGSIDELEPYDGKVFKAGRNPKTSFEKVYDDLIPAIVNCIGSWDYDTGEPEWGKFGNNVSNLRNSKIDNDEDNEDDEDDNVNKRHLSGGLEYLNDKGYVGVMEEGASGTNLRYDFKESNIYDLAELHRFLEQNDSEL